MTRPATHFDLAQSATNISALPRLTPADKTEAVRLSQLRSFTRKDKESLSALRAKYHK